jgi:hypothetical protein
MGASLSVAAGTLDRGLYVGWFRQSPKVIAMKTAGRPRGSRNALSEEVICALLRDFRKHGKRLYLSTLEELQPLLTLGNGRTRWHSSHL